LPADLSAFTLRWSASGQTLQLVTPMSEDIVGTPQSGEPWSPAASVSPDGRYTVYLGDRSVSVMRARGEKAGCSRPTGARPPR
jgi:hypothetical protein